MRIALEWVLRASLDSPGRLAHLWCETHHRLGYAGHHPFEPPFTQAQMAEISGQTSVNVNRVIGAWQRQGIISAATGAVSVDWKELERIGRFDIAYLSDRLG